MMDVNSIQGVLRIACEKACQYDDDYLFYCRDRPE